jgi:2-keto-4-pentenoate hydratase/2-oxohepta-3-ene-1,7-dioic acid hydratase in catechol pathway
MLIARYRPLAPARRGAAADPALEAPRYGYVDGESIGEIKGEIFGDFVRGGRVAALSEVTLLPPCQPSKIITVGPNYPERLREMGVPAPNLPLIYLKAPSSLCGPGEAIRLPPQAQNVQAGVELAVVIGQRARWVTPETALNYVLGYTCANDIIAYDTAEQDQAWTRGSGFDTFGPLGPCIATGLNPHALMMTCAINGVTRQMGSTHDLLFTVPQVLAFVTSAMTLLPGDVILMGTPGGSTPLHPGDSVEVTIESIGSLKNPVVAETGQ